MPSTCTPGEHAESLLPRVHMPTIPTLRVTAAVLFAFVAMVQPATAHAESGNGALQLDVDARDIERHIQQVKLRIPVAPGPLTLVYPRWIPGHHAPTGPINQIAGLVFRANGRVLRWQRDAVDMHAFQLEVPQGASELEAEFQYFSPTSKSQGRIATTPDMLAIQWHRVLLYPANRPVSELRIVPTLHVPPRWTSASALATTTVDASAIRYAETSVETLVDSPVYAGSHLRTIPLDVDRGQPVRLQVMADDARALDIKPGVLAAHRALVKQADRVFGPRPFAHYDFLLAVSKQFSGIGLDHQQSSENGLHAGYLLGETPFVDNDLLAHEYVHAWNGKWMRPDPTWTPDYQQPMRNSLLWMYEGQTQYWAFVLATRSGLYTHDQAMAVLARNAAEVETRSGRRWRDLEDTGNQGIIDFDGSPQAFEDWQRGYDFYTEGSLLWMDVDARLRELSGGRRSLDDFAHAFFAGPAGLRAIKRYGEADIIATLRSIEPKEDWDRFLNQRVHGHDAAPNAWLARDGWKLVWKDSTNAAVTDSEQNGSYRDFSYSLGLVIGNEGDVQQVRWNSPAWRAGMARDMHVIAVNGRSYDGERLDNTLRDAMRSRQATTLLIRDQDAVRTVAIPYFDGPRQPHLERIANTTDALAALLAPR